MITNELYDLVKEGDVEKVSQWLSNAPDELNVCIGDGYTPLHVACLFGHKLTTRWLLARGALVNANAQNASHATPLHLAVGFRDDVVAESLAMDLVENGAELNVVQTGGETPLHHAVARGSLRLVKMLIEAGADPFFTDEAGKTPGDLAKTLEDQALSTSIREQLKKAFSLPLEPI